jgi:hypothetical protein
MKQKTLLIIFLYALSTYTFCQDGNPNRFNVTFSSGIVFPGTIKAAYYSDFNPDETFTFHNSSSLLIKSSIDYLLIKQLSAGISLEYVPIKLKENEFGIDNVTIHMTEFDVTLKYRFILSSKFELKPALAFGIRHTFSSEPDARELGMCLNAGIEGLYNVSDKYYILTDFGFFTQPYGGVFDVVYVKAGPIFYWNFGVGFKF